MGKRKLGKRQKRERQEIHGDYLSTQQIGKALKTQQLNLTASSGQRVGMPNASGNVQPAVDNSPSNITTTSGIPSAAPTTSGIPSTLPAIPGTTTTETSGISATSTRKTRAKNNIIVPNTTPVPTVWPVQSNNGYQKPQGIIQIHDLENVVDKVRVTNVDLTLDTRILSKKMRPSKSENANDLLKTYNNGAFSNHEKEAVDKAFRQILSELQVPITDAAILITPKSSRLTTEQKNQYKGKEYRKVMNTVAERAGVNRTISQIYYFLRHKYDDLRVGVPTRQKWTLQEDEKLKSLIERLGEGHWTEIELALGRTGAKVTN